MCFSQPASLTLGSILLTAGICSTVKAYKADKRYLLLAIAPIIFGIQQIIEGFIWGALDRTDTLSAQCLGYFYLFFAYYFWTGYSPITIYFIEPNLFRKKLLKIMMMTGQLIGAVIYLPILFHIVTLNVSILKHSIYYDSYQSDQLIWFYSFLYMFNLIVPMLISSWWRIKIFGLLVFLSILFSYCFYYYAFTSVWCFFGAGLSVYIAYIIFKLPNTEISK